MIDVKGVHKSFGDLEVLKGIDLDVPAGAVTVILGPSGSGKSTLLRSINHLEKVDRGLVRIDGELIGYKRRGNKLHELREREILGQIAQGKSNPEIAIILGAAEGTIKKHLEHIFEKLSVESRTTAAMMALETLTGRSTGN